MYPTDCLYSKDHEWIRVENDTGVVGISHYAQDELGEVVFVEVPEVGDRFNAHDELGTVESVKAVAEIYAPVTGEIIEVNEALADSPELINEDPYGEGWLVKTQISSPDELSELMDAEAYQQFIESGE